MEKSQISDGYMASNLVLKQQFDIIIVKGRNEIRNKKNGTREWNEKMERKETKIWIFINGHWN